MTQTNGANGNGHLPKQMNGAALLYGNDGHPIWRLADGEFRIDLDRAKNGLELSTDGRKEITHVNPPMHTISWKLPLASEDGALLFARVRGSTAQALRETLGLQLLDEEKLPISQDRLPEYLAESAATPT